MEVIIQTLRQESFNISIEEDNTVGQLKEKVSQVKEIPEGKELNLIYNGSVLENNDKTLTEYGIKNETKIVMLIRKKKVTEENQNSKEENSIVKEEKTENVQEVTVDPQEVTPTGLNIFDNDNNQFGEIEQLKTMMMQNPQLLTKMLMLSPTIQKLSQENQDQLQEKLNDPEFVNEIMDEILTDPSILQKILSTLNNGIDSISNSDDGNQYINVTPQEKQDIDDLVALGYDENLVLQYYLVCDRNKQATASMLMAEKQENEVSDVTQTVSDELSENEKHDIDELVSMGFSRVDVLQYYIACDKNKEATANMMMQNMFG